MRRCTWLVPASMAIVLGSVGVAQQGAALQTPATATPAKFDPVGSIQELMLGVVDPTADFVFGSVSVLTTAQGSKETRPRTDEEWLAVRHNALVLAEAGNLLKMPGRRVAPPVPVPGVKPEAAGPDELSMQQVEALLKQNRVPFDAFAQKLTDAAMIAVRAADARSVDGLYEASDAIDQACESCHSTYWYPGPDSPVRKNLP